MNDFGDIETVLSRAPSVRVGVIGDFCLDFYQVVDRSASEISVETGKATLPVRSVRYSLGGAANVVHNLCALGARGVRCFGVVGTDPHARVLSDLLRSAGADPDGLVAQADEWLTHTYTKVVADGIEEPRIDWGNYNRLSAASADELLSRVERAMPELDVLIVNQQVKSGIHTERLRRGLNDIVRARARLALDPDARTVGNRDGGGVRGGRDGGPTVLVDSRDHGDELVGTVRKLNEREAAAFLQNIAGAPGGRTDAADPSGTAAVADALYAAWGVPLLLTRSENGCLARDSSGLHPIPGLMILSHVDPVGAGDSLLAGTALALAAGASLESAARFGTLVAGVTVQKLYETGTATPQEVRAFARVASYRHNPSLSRNPGAARFFEGTRIEVVEAPAFAFTHAIFDNDGTLSTLRQAWEEAMEAHMIASVFGTAAGTAENAVYGRVVERIREYIDRTTGIQTISQMRGLVGMVRELGFVPEEAVLDEHAYKRLYNDRLMAVVNDRIARLRAGELAPSDFTVKGAVDFLAELHRRGIPLYLASGTDHDDVVREAELLGYARYFEGRIFGSIGDVDNDPKRKVIDALFTDIGNAGNVRIVTFGDGPVEMQETRRRDGYAVGVASNEVRRFGVNPTKRTRLIQAGADAIIGDFAPVPALVRFLFQGG